MAVAVQLGALHLLVAFLAWLAMTGVRLNAPWRSDLNALTLLTSLVVLIGFLAIAHAESRRLLRPHDRLRAKLREVSARDPVWVGAMLLAGLVEEFAYRGVLTTLLADSIGYGAAAGSSAIVFGLGHLSGGWRPAGLGALFALAMQLIMVLSGGLLLAVMVHILYDLIATWLGHRLAMHQQVEWHSMRARSCTSTQSPDFTPHLGWRRSLHAALASVGGGRVPLRCLPLPKEHWMHPTRGRIHGLVATQQPHGWGRLWSNLRPRHSAWGRAGAQRLSMYNSPCS